MSRSKQIQYTPIAPLNLMGRIDGSVVYTVPDEPIMDNSMLVSETTETQGYVVNLLLLQLQLL